MKQSHIISLLKADAKDKPPKRTKWLFYPSEASCIIDGKVVGSCLRRTYYGWKKVPITNQPSLFARVARKIGKYIEVDTKDCLRHRGELVGKSKKDRHFRTEIIDGIVISGEIDAITKRRGKEVGLEIKSYSSRTRVVADNPKDVHIMQALFYLLCYKPRLPYWIIFYRKSPLAYGAKMNDWVDAEGVEHRIDFVKIENDIFPIVNGELNKNISIRKILKRWQLAKYYIKENKIPPCDFSSKSKECGYCPYKNRCQEDNQADKLKIR